MAITDELREYARHLHNVWYDPRGNVYTYTTMDNAPSLDAVRLDEHVLAIADRIDAEHEKACDDAWDNGYEADYLGIENWLIEHQQVMEHHGWVKLPKDADGEPIRIGDVVEWLDESHHPITVVGVGKNTLFYIDDDANAQWTMAITKRHHAKTIEDVLREFALACEDAGNAGPEVGRLAAEYASRLRLAGEGE